MPGQHCPACGAPAAAGGCACSARAWAPGGGHPDLTDTAVLPQVDGPELVRPYVPAPVFADEPAADAFSTTVLPPMRSTVAEIPPMPPHPPGHDLGLFPVQQADPGTRAGRRAQQQQTATKRRATIVLAGAGLAAVGAGLAFLLAPSGSGKSNVAVPQPVGTLDPTLTPEPTATPPSAQPSGPGQSASPSPSRTTATRAKLVVTKAPSPSRPAPSPTPTPSSAASTQAAPSPTFHTLKLGDSGADVSALQKNLFDLGYDDTWTPGVFDQDTQAAVADFQHQAHVHGDAHGVYGPNTYQAMQYYLGN